MSMKRYVLQWRNCTFKALYENHCDFTENSDCILQKCTGAYHDQKHEYPIIYGDFFFIEAIFKLMGNGLFIW